VSKSQQGEIIIQGGQGKNQRGGMDAEVDKERQVRAVEPEEVGGWPHVGPV
jgi:hypothetical protein